MSFKDLHPVKKGILLSAAFSFPICFFSLVIAIEAASSNSMSGGAFILMMAILANLTGLISLIVWITLLVSSRFTRTFITIFISTHTSIWGIGWFIVMVGLTVIGEIEDKVALFFAFPMIVGILSMVKIFRSISQQNANGNNDLPWPPAEK